MLKWLWNFIVGKPTCEHVWKIKNEIDVYAYGESNPQTDMPIATKYILQCEKCGDIKKKRV